MPFTKKQIAAMKKILRSKRQIPVGSKTTAKMHVEHCLWQLIRFANLARQGNPFRGVQFGLNLGRAQEILGSHGAPDLWWRTFEPLIEAKNWDSIMKVALSYLKILGLEPPTKEFIEKK